MERLLHTPGDDQLAVTNGFRIPQTCFGRHVSVGAPFDLSILHPKMASARFQLPDRGVQGRPAKPIEGRSPMRRALLIQRQLNLSAASTRTAKTSPFLEPFIGDYDERTFKQSVIRRMAFHHEPCQVRPSNHAERNQHVAQHRRQTATTPLGQETVRHRRAPTSQSLNRWGNPGPPSSRVGDLRTDRSDGAAAIPNRQSRENQRAPAIAR